MAYYNKNFDKNNPEQESSWAPYRIYNVGGNKRISVLSFIKLLEDYKSIEKKSSDFIYPNNDPTILDFH